MASRCNSKAYGSSNTTTAHERLLRSVEAYFASAPASTPPDAAARVVQTSLPPVYFQHPGASCYPLVDLASPSCPQHSPLRWSLLPSLEGPQPLYSILPSPFSSYSRLSANQTSVR